MEPLSHTKEIFQQLADVDAPMGVKTIIENHDAWVHSDPIRRQITAALRTQLAHAPRPHTVSHRITQQRNTLASLVTRLPLRISSAG